MHIDAPWAPQHTALLRHIMAGTNCCHAPSGRYCPTGAGLRQAYSDAVSEHLSQALEIGS